MAKYDEKYAKLIKKIKRGKVLVVIFTLLAFIGICVLLNESWMALFALVPVYFLEVLAIAVVISPLNTSLNVECDPEKYLALNEAVGNGLQKIIARATGSFYLGEFERSLAAAEDMIASRRSNVHLSGLFNKARSLFFLGRAEEARAVVRQYGEELSASTKMKEKHLAVYNKLGKVLNLMVAISERDSGSMDKFRAETELWNSSKATEGFVRYVKGLAAFHLGDRDGSVYHFMSVKDSYPKTFLAKYAEQYLKELSKSGE